MKSYLDLLEDIIGENVEGTGGSVIGFVAQVLGVSHEDAEAKIGELTIDAATEVADAASQGDAAEIILKMGGLKETTMPIKQPPLPNGVDREDEMGNIINGGPQAGNPDLEDPNDPAAQQDPGAQNQNPNAPQDKSGSNRPQTKPGGTVTRSSGTQGTGPRPQPMAETFRAGEEVKVAGKEAIVSGIDDGPAGTDTVGVLVDGTLEMVKKDSTMKKTVEEGIMGMAAMPSMRQMMELAMFQSKPDEDDKGKDEDEDDKDDAGSDDKVEAKEEINTTETETKTDETAKMGIAIFDVQNGNTVDVGVPTDPIQQPEQTSDPEAECDPREQILKALDTIENIMPDLRVGDYKDVRRRLDKISNIIVEKAMNRRQKPV